MVRVDRVSETWEVSEESDWSETWEVSEQSDSSLLRNRPWTALLHAHIKFRNKVLLDSWLYRKL